MVMHYLHYINDLRNSYHCTNMYNIVETPTF